MNNIEILRMLNDIAKQKEIMAMRDRAHHWIDEVLNDIADERGNKNRVLEIQETGSKTEAVEHETAPAEDEPLLRKKNIDKKNQSGGVKRPFDTGKLRALRKAGWKVKDIAEEMKCSEATIYNNMKKAGIK